MKRLVGMRIPAAAALAVVGIVSLAGASSSPQAMSMPAQHAPEKDVPDLKPAGEKNPLPGGGWFDWDWALGPKVGRSVLRVKVFEKDGSRSTTLTIFGDPTMPIMPEADKVGATEFKRNDAGDYLLPLDFDMAGEWVVVVALKRGPEALSTGRLRVKL